MMVYVHCEQYKIVGAKLTSRKDKKESEAIPRRCMQKLSLDRCGKFGRVLKGVVDKLSN